MTEIETFPKKKLVGFRNDQYILLEKAKAVSGRNLSDMIREGAVKLARALIIEHSKNKDL